MTDPLIGSEYALAAERALRVRLADTLDTRPGLQSRAVLIHGTPPDFPHYNWVLDKIINNPDGTVEATLSATGRTL